MAVNAGILKVVVSFYCIDSETAHKRHRSRIPINNVNTVLELKKHLILFLGLQEFSSKSPCLSSCNDSTRSTKTIVHHLQTLAVESGNSKLVQVRPPLEKPTSICAASEDILLCADDAQRGIIQVTLHCNGIGIAGTGLKLVTYPTSISNVISKEVLSQRAYFAAFDLDGELYVCKPISLEVDPLLKNNSESCKGIKTPCEFEDGMAFTDSGDRVNVLSKTLKP